MKKRNNTTRFISLSMILILLNACASEIEIKKESALDQMISDAFENNQSSVSAADQSATENEIASALLPDINLSAPGAGSIDVEPRFDIKVYRSKVRPFFMGLVEDSNYNMVLHPDVKGRITLDLKNVNVADVMGVVRDVYGYDFEITKMGYSVFPNTMRTRIFTMNYLNVNRTGGSNMSVSSGQVTESVSGGSSGGSFGGSTIGAPQNVGGAGSSGNTISGSSLSTESTSNFWGELKDSLVALVGHKADRSVVVSPQAGMVVVRAMPHELRAIEKFINKTQNFVQRQVIIEAKILEVELSERFQTGINWAALSASGSNSTLLGQTGGGSIFDGSGVSSIIGSAGELNPSALSQISGTATTAFGGMFSLALNAGSNFSAFIELLKTQGDVQVLSSPQVSTVNNQKAVIKVGKDEFFITDVRSNTSTSTAVSSTQSNVQLTPFFSGVALDVIPQISEHGDIILHVHPTVSSVTEKTKDISTSSTTTLSVPLAISTIRESDSIVRAKSGQVIIIGGLMQNSIEQRVSKVPLLGDIPLIGGLFRHTKEVSKKSELVILLRPTVVNSSRQMSEQVKRMKSHLKHVRYR